jgi:cell wall-associated NlpC family hydrolase
MKNSRPESGPHWALAYIGRPFVSGGRGPHGYDCWGLVRAHYRRAYNIDIEAARACAHDLRQVMRDFAAPGLYRPWRRVSEPMDGDCALMRQGRHVCHVGLWASAGGGKMVHALPGSGVVAQNLPDIEWAGYEIDSFWRHEKRDSGLCDSPQSL